jgi:hypothetical protein
MIYAGRKRPSSHLTVWNSPLSHANVFLCVCVCDGLTRTSTYDHGPDFLQVAPRLLDLLVRDFAAWAEGGDPARGTALPSLDAAEVAQRANTTATATVETTFVTQADSLDSDCDDNEIGTGSPYQAGTGTAENVKVEEVSRRKVYKPSRRFRQGVEKG